MNQRWLVDQTEWRAPCPRIVSAKRHHYSWWWGSSPTGGSSLLNWRELHSHSWTSDLLTPRSQVYPKQPRLISLPVGFSFIINWVFEGVPPIHQSHWDALSGQQLWGCSGEQEIYLKQSFKGHLFTILEMKSELPCREDFSECVASWLLVNGPSVHQVTKLSLWTLTSHSL